MLALTEIEPSATTAFRLGKSSVLEIYSNGGRGGSGGKGQQKYFFGRPRDLNSLIGGMGGVGGTGARGENGTPYNIVRKNLMLQKAKMALLARAIGRTGRTVKTGKHG